MIPYSEALSLLLSAARPDAPESVSVGQATGRISAQEILSPDVLPRFDNSGMDGFAVRCGGETLQGDTELDVGGAVMAGDAPSDGFSGALAIEIATGAPVPPGFDAVVPIEKVEVLARSGGRPARIRLTGAVSPGDNVRDAGSDIARGDLLVPRGCRLGPSQLMGLAAMGVDEVEVVPRPRAGIIATGTELVEGRAPDPGEVRNSNGPFLDAVLRAEGVDVVGRVHVEDDPQRFLDEVGRSLEEGADLVLSTGAVSVGRHDFVPASLARMGARTLFHRVATRPAHPTFAAELPGGGLFLGLPGNPMSTAAGWRFFALPFLRELRGMPPEVPLRLPLQEEVRTPGSLRAFLRGELVAAPEDAGTAEDADAQRAFASVRVPTRQESFRIAPFLAADVWVVVPEGVTTLAPGHLVDVHGLTAPLV
ncbi:MAG: molybdopterin molybdotransferase MoeA [Gemmatimonadota bacterium]